MYRKIYCLIYGKEAVPYDTHTPTASHFGIVPSLQNFVIPITDREKDMLDSILHDYEGVLYGKYVLTMYGLPLLTCLTYLVVRTKRLNYLSKGMMRNKIDRYNLHVKDIVNIDKASPERRKEIERLFGDYLEERKSNPNTDYVMWERKNIQSSGRVAYLLQALFLYFVVREVMMYNIRTDLQTNRSYYENSVPPDTYRKYMYKHPSSPGASTK